MNIETERLIIKPLTLDDAKRFSEYRDKEEVAMYQSWDEYPLNKAINRIVKSIHFMDKLVTTNLVFI